MLEAPLLLLAVGLLPEAGAELAVLLHELLVVVFCASVTVTRSSSFYVTSILFVFTVFPSVFVFIVILV